MNTAINAVVTLDTVAIVPHRAYTFSPGHPSRESSVVIIINNIILKRIQKCMAMAAKSTQDVNIQDDND